MKKTLFALAVSGLLAMQAEAVKIALDSEGNPIYVTSAYSTAKKSDFYVNGVKADGSPVEQVDVDWNISYDYEPNKVTYWTKIHGNYDINLGIASITMQTGGTLNVYITNTDWSSPYGIGMTSNYDPYKVWNHDKGDSDPKNGHMSVYIGKPGDQVWSMRSACLRLRLHQTCRNMAAMAT